MTPDQRVYRTVLRSYPRRFRHEYADDMVAVFGELLAHKGRAATWRRALVDLVVTVPRYRLETLMAPQRSTTALIAVATTLTLVAVATFAAGFWPLGVLLVLVAAALGVSARSHLVRSLRPGDPSHRRRLLLRSAALGLIAVGVLAVGMIDLGDERHWATGRLVLYNSLFFGAAVAALAHLIIAVRHPDNDAGPLTSAA